MSLPTEGEQSKGPEARTCILLYNCGKMRILGEAVPTSKLGICFMRDREVGSLGSMGHLTPRLQNVRWIVRFTGWGTHPIVRTRGSRSRALYESLRSN